MKDTLLTNRLATFSVNLAAWLYHGGDEDSTWHTAELTEQLADLGEEIIDWRPRIARLTHIFRDHHLEGLGIAFTVAAALHALFPTYIVYQIHARSRMQRPHNDKGRLGYNPMREVTSLHLKDAAGLAHWVKRKGNQTTSPYFNIAKIKPITSLSFAKRLRDLLLGRRPSRRETPVSLLWNGFKDELLGVAPHAKCHDMYTSRYLQYAIDFVFDYHHTYIMPKFYYGKRDGLVLCTQSMITVAITNPQADVEDSCDLHEPDTDSD